MYDNQFQVSQPALNLLAKKDAFFLSVVVIAG